MTFDTNIHVLVFGIRRISIDKSLFLYVKKSYPIRGPCSTPNVRYHRTRFQHQTTVYVLFHIYELWDWIGDCLIQCKLNLSWKSELCSVFCNLGAVDKIDRTQRTNFKYFMYLFWFHIRPRADTHVNMYMQIISTNRFTGFVMLFAADSGTIGVSAKGKYSSVYQNSA